MEYRCVDVGTEKCPCILMEAGQCYTCRMCWDGVCACGESWRGSCPYTTWLQQGGRIQDAPRVSEALILSVREYAPHLSVVTLSVPRGLAQRCRTLGTYIIVESLGWHIPLSVLRSTYAAGTASHTTPAAASTAGTAPAGSASTDIQSASIKTDTDLIPASAFPSAIDAAGGGQIEIAIQPIGPKSRALLQDLTAPWRIRGPFYGGLTALGRGALHPADPLLVIAKGTAIAPLINILERFCQAGTQDISSTCQAQDTAAASQAEATGSDLQLSTVSTASAASAISGAQAARAAAAEKKQRLTSGLRLLIDADKLSADFLTDYLKTQDGQPIPWQPIRLASEMDRAAVLIAESRQTLFLASPYYAAQAKKAFLKSAAFDDAARVQHSTCGLKDREDAISQARNRCLLLPNHANICCGIGICGACSETDGDGVTVRKCKCAQTETVVR